MQPLPALHPSDADFAAIRAEGGFYVDKTPPLRTLLATTSTCRLVTRHQFLARPRRFGKTLLINTLEAWFQGLPPGHRANPEGDTAELKGMPAGWTSPPWLWEGLEVADWHGVHGWHPVIRLDLSQLGSPDPAGTRAGLRDYMEDRVWQWTARGAPWSSAWPASLLASGSERLLRNLIQCLEAAYGRQPVVLVDEYDAPIVKHMGTDRDLQPAVEGLQDFFRVLKDDEGLLYGVFVTGITRVARNHLFSAANNIVDISDWSDYGGLCGFTADEVDRHFNPYVERMAELEPRLRDRDVRSAWRTCYNGYRFAPGPEAPRVYNPFTLTRGVSEVLADADKLRQAAEGVWPSAWSRSGHPGLIVRLANDPRQPRPMPVWYGDQVPPPINGGGDPAHPDHVRLMLDTGYYTWHGSREGGNLHIGFPNREVADSWLRDIFNAWAVPDNEFSLGDLNAALRSCLAQGDTKGFVGRLETFIFGLAHENLRYEYVFNAVLQSLFQQLADATQSEKPSGSGRLDHEVLVGNRLYVFEVKFNRSPDAALRQIRDRQYGREHLVAGRQVTALGLAFRKDLRGGARLQYREADLATLFGAPSETDVEREGTGDNSCSLHNGTW